MIGAGLDEEQRLPLFPLTLRGLATVSYNDQFSVPAGWYPDPLGIPQLRWWNGEGWTEQVSAAPEPLTTYEAPAPAVRETVATTPAAPAQLPAAPTPSQLEAARVTPAPAMPAEEPIPVPVQVAQPYTKYAVSDWKPPVISPQRY
jgi:hypothetical protein